MTKFVMNGITLEGSFTDVDFVEGFEEAYKSFEEGKDTAETPREQLNLIDGFIDNVFGAGSAEKIFKGKSELLDRLDFIDVLFNEYTKSQQEVNKRAGKYSARFNK